MYLISIVLTMIGSASMSYLVDDMNVAIVGCMILLYTGGFLCGNADGVNYMKKKGF